MNWEKLPQIKPDDMFIGCLNCSTAALEAPLDMTICVGFGCAYVTKDGEMIYDGERDSKENDTYDVKTVKDIEEWALKDPDHDWRIVKHGSMHGETFQRHGPNKWVCIESDPGFA
jgi:hypothetical protein